MNWQAFAEKIRGEFTENAKGFIGGDNIVKDIYCKESSPKIFIQKKVRRGFEASSHYGVEKFRFEFIDEKFKFEGTRIRKKIFLKRLFLKKENHFNIDGNKFFAQKISPLSCLNNLLNYSNSELIFLDNKIIFKAQSLGIMDEDLEEIYFSMNAILIKIKK